MSKPPKNHNVSIWDDYENSSDTVKCDITTTEKLPEAVQKCSDRSNLDNPRLVTVKTLAALYGLTLNSIYTLIKTDLSFPFKNLGVKKKYMFDPVEFEQWMNNRTTAEKDRALNIPKAVELIKRYKK